MVKQAYYCPKCGKRMVMQDKKPCEYIQTKDGWISGCGMRVSWNKTWRFCPICGKTICKMGWIERSDND